MTTAQQVIDFALKKSGVVAASQVSPNDKSVIALELLNDWIAELKNDGLDLQLDALGLDDEIYLDASDVPCLKHNLTVLVAENWKLPLPDGALLRAETSLDKVRGKYLAADVEEMDLPELLLSHRRSDIRSGF